MIIGLTGNIASGKSTVARYLEDLGAAVIDTDQLARQIVLPGTPALKEIFDSFGPGILHNDGTLDRKKLGSLIFKDPASRQRLEQITHPRIETELEHQISYIRDRDPEKVIVLQIPLLIEAGWQHRVDQVWLVLIAEEEQLKRLMQRDKLTREQACDRIASQMPQEQKIPYAHVIINNNGTPEDVRQQVIEAWHNLS